MEIGLERQDMEKIRKILDGWKNYSGTTIGPKWNLALLKLRFYSCEFTIIYKGNEFKEWSDALIGSLKDQSLRKIKFKKNEFIEEELIFKDTIGRIRDIEIQMSSGKLYIITDQGSLWKLQKWKKFLF